MNCTWEHDPKVSELPRQWQQLREGGVLSGDSGGFHTLCPTPSATEPETLQLYVLIHTLPISLLTGCLHIPVQPLMCHTPAVDVGF